MWEGVELSLLNNKQFEQLHDVSQQNKNGLYINKNYLNKMLFGLNGAGNKGRIRIQNWRKLKKADLTQRMHFNVNIFKTGLENKR